MSEIAYTCSSLFSVSGVGRFKITDITNIRHFGTTVLLRKKTAGLDFFLCGKPGKLSAQPPKSFKHFFPLLKYLAVFYFI